MVLKQRYIKFSAGIEKDNLSIMFYGKNINDDKYLISAFVAVASNFDNLFWLSKCIIELMVLTVNYMF